jgi:FeS assembly SUF system protein
MFGSNRKLTRVQTASDATRDVPAQPESNPEKSVDPLREQIVDALRGVYDPEIPVNIYDLGLVYNIDIDPMGGVDIAMTLTAPACPVAGTMPPMVEQAVSRVAGVSEAHVKLVWDPPWSKERMSEAARLQLGMV